MIVKPLSIGRNNIKNNIFLAPMAGFTDFAIRNLCTKLGAGLCFTELVSAKGVVYGSKGTNELVECGGDYQNNAVQIFGSDPYYMRKAIEDDALNKFQIVDINMGCPVPKVYKNGEGSALLNNIYKAEKIIKECVKSKKDITVKIRIGLKKGDDIATEFAKMAENAGAKLITIHGRIREDYYSGEPNFDAIAHAKSAVGIPVIANGGIFTVKDADDMMDKTGADGVMIARGAIANPFIFCEFLGNTCPMTLFEYIVEHLNLSRAQKGDQRAAVEFRKFVPYYFKGMLNAKEVKQRINTACTTQEIIDILTEFFNKTNFAVIE